MPFAEPASKNPIALSLDTHTVGGCGADEPIRLRAAARASRGMPAYVLRGALAIALLVHVLLAWWLRDLMRTQPPPDVDRIAVRLIDPIPPEPALPVPPAAPVPVTTETQIPLPMPRIVVPTPPSTTAPEKATADAPPEMSVHIYNTDGSIVMPAPGASSPSANFVPRSTAPSPIMLPHRPIKIRPNYFAKAWRAPQNENLLGEALRKTADFVDENLTVKKEFTTPWGSKIKCAAGFMVIMAAAGCGWGMPPPPGGRPTEHWKPATELDEE